MATYFIIRHSEQTMSLQALHWDSPLTTHRPPASGVGDLDVDVGLIRKCKLCIFFRSRTPSNCKSDGCGLDSNSGELNIYVNT